MLNFSSHLLHRMEINVMKKESFEESCKLTKVEELKHVALSFVNYLVKNGLIAPGQIEKNQLIRWYSEFQGKYPSHVKSSEIMHALSVVHVLKKRGPFEFETSQFVSFKDIIFRKNLDVKPPTEELLLPRIRVFTNHAFTFKNKSVKESEIDGLNCKICRKTYDSNAELDRHQQSEDHILKKQYRNEKHTFKREVPFLKISDVNAELDINEKQQFILSMKNISESPLTIRFLQSYKLYELDKIITECELPKTIKQGESFEYKITVCFTSYGDYQEPVVFVLKDSGSNDVVKLLTLLTFSVIKEEFRDLGPKEPYTRPVKNKIRFQDLSFVSGPPLNGLRVQLRYKFLLKQYLIPPSLHRILNRGFKKTSDMNSADKKELEKIRTLLCGKSGKSVLHNRDALCKENYFERFRYLLWIEEQQKNKDIHFYDKTDVELIVDKKYGSHLYGLFVPGLSENRPSVLRGDSVFIRHSDEKINYEGIVHVVEESKVYLAFNDSFNYVAGGKVHVEFYLNRLTLRICHRALEQVFNEASYQHLFPMSIPENLPVEKIDKFKNELLEKNMEQKRAVENIVSNTAYPAPYIIYGPPGTGKTATIVEAIVQLYIRKPSSKICVCAPSNAAADLIAIRLLKFVPASSILRVYGMYRSPRDIPEEIKPCSNYNIFANELIFPEVEHIIKKNILIVTPVTGGRVYGIVGSFVDYLFIDEAGHAEETVSMIPIMGLLKRKQVHKTVALKGSLIMAGDPKQLGPIIHSTLAAYLGLDISYLERLMLQCDLYKKDKFTKEYNPRVITKLLHNYRSHEALLYLPNKLFYENELIAAADRVKTNCLSSWEDLPKTNFPLIFHGICGKEDREGNSPSYFNQHEIQAVGSYLKELINNKIKGYTVKATDIVILTPYRKQVHKFRDYIMKAKLKGVTVSSVEEFQGQEKLIVIISTVRSRQEFIATDYQFGIGFLRNPKRFSVAISRAIALMIVVGNPNILQTDPYWRELIDYCRKNGSYKGIEPTGSVSSNLDPNQVLTLDLSALTLNSDEIPESEKKSFPKYD